MNESTGSVSSNLEVAMNNDAPNVKLNFITEDNILALYLLDGPGRQFTAIVFSRREHFFMLTFDHRFANNKAPGKGDIINVSACHNNNEVAKTEEEVLLGTNSYVGTLISNGYGGDFNFVPIHGDVSKLTTVLEGLKSPRCIEPKLVWFEKYLDGSDTPDVIEFEKADDEEDNDDGDDGEEEAPKPPKKPVNRIAGI